MKLITIWTDGKSKLPSGYRRLFIMKFGRKWIHCFQPHDNTYLKLRKKQLKEWYVRKEVVNKEHWAKYCRDKLINEHYRTIFFTCASEEEVEKVQGAQIIELLTEIRDLLKKPEKEIIKYSTIPKGIADEIDNELPKRRGRPKKNA